MPLKGKFYLFIYLLFVSDQLLHFSSLASRMVLRWCYLFVKMMGKCLLKESLPLQFHSVMLMVQKLDFSFNTCKWTTKCILQSMSFPPWLYSEVLPTLTGTCVTFILTNLYCFGKLSWIMLCIMWLYRIETVYFIQSS